MLSKDAWLASLQERRAALRNALEEAKISAYRLEGALLEVTELLRAMEAAEEEPPTTDSADTHLP